MENNLRISSFEDFKIKEGKKNEFNMGFRSLI